MHSLALSKSSTVSLASVLRTRSAWPCFVAALFAILAGALPLHAQVAASITGIVIDPSGAPVPAARVTTKNLETAALRNATTDDTGRYLVLSLPVGQYEVRVSKAGFQGAIRSGIYLVIGQEAHVDFRLLLQQMETGISVTADAPIVGTTPNDISGLVGEQQIKELPLNGRSYDLLLPLNPGIVNFTSLKTGGTRLFYFL